MSTRPELILHQYAESPFSEKVRKLFALKELTWRAVDQPSIMPKPDLVSLTGGYRRIPVLQVGADIYCDTQLIARTLERLHPTPTLYPGASEGTCQAWSLWADRFLFIAVVAVVFGEIGQFVPKEFIDDRSKMMPGRDFSELPAQAPQAREQLRAFVSTIEENLVDGRPYLLGAEMSLADAACFHPLWFLRIAPQANLLLGEFPRLRAWFERLELIGQGARIDMTPAEALAVAKAARSTAPVASDSHEPNGLAPGANVFIVPDDYGFDPVHGELVFSNVHEVAVRRTDPAVGEVVVHFPRIGFRVSRGN